jgi:GDP-L-fucose synthase
MSFYRGKKVLVAGGSGLIGTPLVEMLADKGASVRIISMDKYGSHSDMKIRYKSGSEGDSFVRDLRYFNNCEDMCKSMDIVFNLVGVKGSPSATLKYPASFFVPTIQTSINMMEAARRAGVKHYLHTSTVGVYPPAEVFHEDDMWKGNPSPNDWFAGWAKRMAELQADAYAVEYDWKCSIVRPANVYGPYDWFDSSTAMVLPSLIARVVNGENPLTVWGDGSAIRDFVHAKDVARGMMMAVEQGITKPLNIASGKPVTIKEVAEIVARNAPGGPVEIIWDKNKPKGDARRLMDISRAQNYGYQPIYDLEKGIKETIEWYAANRESAGKRYIAFNDREMSSGRKKTT